MHNVRGVNANFMLTPLGLSKEIPLVFGPACEFGDPFAKNLTSAISSKNTSAELSVFFRIYPYLSVG